MIYFQIFTTFRYKSLKNSEKEDRYGWKDQIYELDQTSLKKNSICDESVRPSTYSIA